MNPLIEFISYHEQQILNLSLKLKEEERHLEFLKTQDPNNLNVGVSIRSIDEDDDIEEIKWNATANGSVEGVLFWCLTEFCKEKPNEFLTDLNILVTVKFNDGSPHGIIMLIQRIEVEKLVKKYIDLSKATKSV